MEILKRLVHHFMNVIVVLIVLAGGMGYMGVTTVIMTKVINALQVDTYITYDTGFGVVMLILLLGWLPVWMLRIFSSHRRYTGRL